MKTNKKFNISKIKSTVVAAQLMALPLLTSGISPENISGMPNFNPFFPWK